MGYLNRNWHEYMEVEPSNFYSCPFCTENGDLGLDTDTFYQGPPMNREVVRCYDCHKTFIVKDGELMEQVLN